MGPRVGQHGQRPDGGWKRHGTALWGRLAPMVLLPLLGFFSPTPAMAADAATTSDLVLIAIVFAAASLALAGGLWGLSERQDNRNLRRTLRTATAKARALLSARDAWLSAGREALLVWTTDNAESISFGNGAQLMEACLTGPDALQLSSALDGLAAYGTPFALSCRTAEGRRLALRGRPSGGHLAVFLEPEGRDAAHGPDFRGALDAMPVPAWIRGKDLSLAFVNRAFLAASGETEDSALAANLAFDRSERDLAATAHGNSETVEAKRFATLSGQRRALAFTLNPLPDGSVAGAALDVTGVAEAEARLQAHIEAHADSLDRVSTAGAIYGPDRKLTFFNRAYVRLWGLPESWLKTHPAYGDVLDRLRELRKLPEQPDFRAWKQQRTKLFEHRDQHPEERWHLPSGQTLRVMAQPHPFGGLIFLFEDMSDQLRLESSYNTLIKVQKATPDTLQERVPAFRS